MERFVNWLIGFNLLFFIIAISIKFLTGYFESGFISWSSFGLSVLLILSFFLKRHKPFVRSILYISVATFFLAIFLSGIFDFNAMIALAVIALFAGISVVYGLASKQLKFNKLNIILLGSSSALALFSIVFKMLHLQYVEIAAMLSVVCLMSWTIYHYFIQPPST